MESSRNGDSKRLYEGTSQESRIEGQDSKLLSKQDQTDGERLLETNETLIDFEGGEDLTGLFDVQIEPENTDKTEIQNRIQQAKRFYFLHFDYQVNLNHDSFHRFRPIASFKIGYKYKGLVDNMKKVELLTQVVNERVKLRGCCKTMYFREGVLRLDKSQNTMLLSKYLGITIRQANDLIKKEVQECEWFIKVYRNRLNYVCELLQEKYSFTIDEIKNIRNYEDVINYC